MSPQAQLANSTMSHPLPSIAGKPPELFKSRPSLRGIAVTSCQTGVSPRNKIPQLVGVSRKTTLPSTSSIAGSLPQSKKKTCNDKSDIYLTNIPSIPSCQTSDPVSISRDPDYYPFWSESLKEVYDRWSLPPKIDSVASPSTSSLTSSDASMPKSWFSTKSISRPSTKSERTFWPSCKFSLVDGMVKGDTKTRKVDQQKIQIVHKIRAYPTPLQKQMLAKMAGTTRHLFNHTISMIRDKSTPFESQAAHDEKKDQRKKSFDKTKAEDQTYKETDYPWLNFIYMRNFLVNNKSTFVLGKPWMAETANSVRQIAVREAISSYKACLSNLKAGNIKNFGSPFRKKKNRSWSIGLDPTQLKWNRVLPASIFGKLKIAEEKFLRAKYTSQPRITRDRYMNYYLIILEDINVVRKNDPNPKSSDDAENNNKPVMSIDPGVRTRHTIFSTANGGQVKEIGAGDIQRIVRTAKRIDKQISQSCDRGINHRARRRLLKQRLKLTMQIANLKKEMDYQTINYLSKTASVVLLPTFKVHSMACRLRSKTARQLLCWGHGLFKDRLIEASKRCDLKVMIVSEHYTSKTCGSCGRLNRSLGGSKHFKCRHEGCGFESDRDHNGARNILLRAIRVR